MTKETKQELLAGTVSKANKEFMTGSCLAEYCLPQGCLFFAGMGEGA